MDVEDGIAAEGASEEDGAGEDETVDMRMKGMHMSRRSEEFEREGWRTAQQLWLQVCPADLHVHLSSDCPDRVLDLFSAGVLEVRQ
jgi:hypothetical protein